MSSQCRKRNPRPSAYPNLVSKNNLVDVADNSPAEIEPDGNKKKYNTFLKLLSGESTIKMKVTLMLETKFFDESL